MVANEGAAVDVRYLGAAVTLRLVGDFGSRWCRLATRGSGYELERKR